MNPTATLWPTGVAYESVGDLRLDIIRGIRLWLRRSANHAALTARCNERWIGGSVPARWTERSATRDAAG